MKTIIRLLTVAFLIASVTEARSEKVQYGGPAPTSRNLKQTTAGCTPSSTFAWLNINNARVRVNAGGDMWWDLPGGSGAKYYIPANGSATSLYAGSLWIAGMDVNNQLKCAAVRFRQGANFNGGNDFWTGPLTVDGTASIDAQTCMMYDKMYNITRAEVDEFLANCDPKTGIPYPEYISRIPANILNWPAHGEVAGISHYLAPFYDNDGDGEYNPAVGDYPFYDIENKYCHTKVPTMEEQYNGTVKGSILADQLIKGDQTIWWVFNDKGNAHTETGGSAIGMEIRAQAFAFATNDEINNMTFYSYEIINRSTYTLTNTYFSPWTDVDLGYAKDDYVGCDVSRGLGYGYNGAPVDGNGEPEAYGPNPPAVGVDFFQGPYLDPVGFDRPKYKYDPLTGDSIQLCDESINGVNFGNGIPDDERYGMRRFVYHDNTDNPINGDPKEAAEYYLLLRGIWKNGSKMEYGGTAVPGAAGTVGPACDFMFPFDSDPCNWGTGGLTPGGIFAQEGVYWSEETGNNGGPNPANDRRFMQSAGPFTLKAGAVNYITFGVPWARANTGEAWASVELLRKVDDKCQSMFDRCFKVLDGPDAPDLTIRELDRQLIVYISNSPSSNNANEDYIEEDQNIKGNNPDGSVKDPYYRFEGYQIYQLANNTVSVDELTDDTKARLIFQCDVDNNVGQIINWVQDEDLKVSVPTLMVQGADNGITHSFVVTQDAFTINTDPTLVNHKTYYFMAIAYAYNNYLEYKVDEAAPEFLFGQKTPYLAGRKNIKLYSAVPHKIVNGTVINSTYQSQPAIKRWAGLGNGGNRIELEKGVEDEILSKGLASQKEGDYFYKIPFGSEDYPIVYHPSYKAGYGPLDVKVVDPLNVVPTDYSLFLGDFYDVTMHGVTGNVSIVGDTAVKKTARWYLHDMQEDGVYYESNMTIEKANEMLFLERGLSITITQPYNIGPIKVGSQGIDASTNTPIPAYQVLAPKNGMLHTAVTYADSSNRWLGGIYDDDDYVGTPLNWIRSGTYGDQDNKANNDYKVKSGAAEKGSQPFDPDENYEHIADGSWAPYVLTYVSGTVQQNFPGPMYELSMQPFAENTFFNNTRSIDIVLTADKSKWTRCPVMEMCMDSKLSDGNVEKFRLRDAASVDKNGVPTTETGSSTDPEAANYISDHGMGWFPGYAIDIETGIRLNMMFGEDSFLKNMNGDDMQFNPVALKENTVLGIESQYSDPALFGPVDKAPLMGGKHYVYVLPLNPWDVKSAGKYKINFAMPAYDAGAMTMNILDSIAGATSTQQKIFMKAFWRLPGWVGMPMAIEGREWLQPGNPVRISVRISKPYEPGFGDYPLETVSDKLKEYIDESDTTLMRLYSFPNPYYTFSTKDMVPTKFEANKQKSDLDLIRVVPNPYYAWSSYEANALTHKVKIVNVPDKCVVTIYTVNGTKIRQFKKDDATTTSIDWDLTNHANTPIASGIYLIHVKDLAAGGGEKTVKFYCAMRQVDLNTF